MILGLSACSSSSSTITDSADNSANSDSGNSASAEASINSTNGEETMDTKTEIITEEHIVSYDGKDVYGKIYYPALNIPDDWRNNFKSEADIPEENEFWGMTLGKKFFTSIRDFHTFDNIGTYKGNVLIIYGDQDPIVPSGAMDKAVEAYENIEYVVLEGEGHGFSPEGGKKAINKVIDFISSAS